MTVNLNSCFKTYYSLYFTLLMNMLHSLMYLLCYNKDLHYKGPHIKNTSYFFELCQLRISKHFTSK